MTFVEVMMRGLGVLLILALASGCAASDTDGETSTDGDADVAAADVSSGDTTPHDGGPPSDVTTADTAPEVEPSGPCAGLADGSACDDEDPCTSDDLCAAGLCIGTPLVCESDDPCQEATCDPVEGCIEAPRADGTPCEVHCFEAATCQTGVCTAAAETEIGCPPSADPCVEAILCDPNTGLCDDHVLAHEGTACNDDDDVCSLEACDDKGKCVDTQEANTCETELAAYPCWNWVCNALSGCLQTTPAVEKACDDGDPCTTLDQCVAVDGGDPTCVGEATATDDGNPCTEDLCDEAGVQNFPVADGTPCLPVDDAPCGDAAVCTSGLCVPPADCSCTVDADCDALSWCRPTEEGGTACVPYQEEGESCGGFVPYWMLEKCLPELICEDQDPNIADEPGICSAPEDPPDPEEPVPCDDPGDGNTCVVAPVSQDTWLENASQKGTQVWLLLGKHDTYPKKRSLLQFDLSTVPEGATVLSATMKVYFVYAHKASFSDEPGVDRLIRAHRLLVPWNEASATSVNAQNGQPWSSSLGGVDGTDAAADPEDTQLFEWEVTKVWHDFDLTELVGGWMADPSSNHGVLLMADNEDTPGRDMRLRSSDAPETEEHPFLEVVYSVP